MKRNSLEIIIKFCHYIKTKKEIKVLNFLIEWKKTDVHASHALSRVWFHDMLGLCVWPINRTLCLARQQQHSSSSSGWLFLIFLYFFLAFSYIFFSSIYLTRRHLKGKEYKDYNRHSTAASLLIFIIYRSKWMNSAHSNLDRMWVSPFLLFFSLSLSLMYLCVYVYVLCV